MAAPVVNLALAQQLAPGPLALPAIQQDERVAQEALGIFQKLFPAVERGFSAFVEILKNEKLAITALFLSALGILPVWMNIATAVSCVAYLAITMSNLRAEVAQNQIQLAQLTVVNGDLQFLRNHAQAALDEAIRERDAIRLERGVLAVNLNAAEQQKEAVTQERDFLKRDHVHIARQNEAFVEERAANLQRQLLLEEETRALIQARQAAFIERDEAFLARDAAVREKADLEHDLAQTRQRLEVTPFQQTLLAAENVRNQHLAQIKEMYQQLRGGQDPHGQLDTDIQALSEFQRLRGAEALAAVTEAIRGIPSEHRSWQALEQSRVILSTENQSLGAIAFAFALHSAVQDLQKEPRREA